MSNGREVLFTDARMSQEFDEEVRSPTEWYGLARKLPAMVDEPILAGLQPDTWQMTRIASRALAAQEAVGNLYLFSLFRAEATIAAVEDIVHTLNATSGMPALEEFHRTQRSQFLACLSEIATRCASLILAELR